MDKTRPVSTEELHFLQTFFNENEYVHVKSILTPGAIEECLDKITFEENNFRDDKLQFNRVHNDKKCGTFIHEILQELRPLYDAITNCELHNCHGFAMKSLKDCDMDAHYDNFNNSISSTVCYYHSSEQEPSPIFLDKEKFHNPYPIRLSIKNKSSIPIEHTATMDLKPGDIGIFKGRNHLHWRNKMTTETDYRAVLLHFNDYYYKGEPPVNPHPPAQIEI